MSPLDRIDRAILTALQNNARLSNKELAAQVGLAPSSCLTRVRKLEAEGVIQAYRAQLDPRALGLGLQALIGVQLRLHVGEAFGSIGNHLRSLPETVAVYCLGGSTDFLVHVVCRDTEHLRVLTIQSFTSRPEVARIETSLVFSFTSSGLPVAPEDAAGAGPLAARRSPLAAPARRGSRAKR
ncbi:Lrp/AsnC family transcriptional regulator [Corallococcus sp. CA053C]|nr:Lrp/AsnC family transcriptional regulator [Corallococcus sp. CA053C]